ncbi:unnamed protein product [Symbiodinium sp. CCMP2592]|nr:unnamed protein product [Symbiodinium sp. CCMP2592]
MAKSDPELVKLLKESGLDDKLVDYVAARDIRSRDIFASIATSVQEVDAVLMEPLVAGFKMPQGESLKLDALQLPIVRAKFRYVWRKCSEATCVPSTPAAAALPLSAPASKSTKELQPGYWQTQVAKYEAIKIGGEFRRFPQEYLLGTEPVLARIVNEMKSLSHTSVALHELVQNRFFSRGGEPNPLCPAKKRAKTSTAVLTINQDNQLETAPDAQWSPKSVISFLDCLEAIRFAFILVEIGPEPAVCRYIDWWEKQVRARQHRLEQLKIFWDIAAWRIAMALRSKIDFATVTFEMINDNQALQDALNREVATENYERRWSDRRWDDSRYVPYKSQWEHNYADRQHDKYQRASGAHADQQQARGTETALLYGSSQQSKLRGAEINKKHVHRKWQWQAVLWESNPELRKLASAKFPSAVVKEDVDKETPDSIIAFLEQIDPGAQALVIIAAGPPCPDYSRVRENAPGTSGPEGSKFVRFAELIKSLEKKWRYAQCVLLVENVVPANKEDVRRLGRALSAQAVMHDAGDFGLVTRPRLWWTRIPWQELSHRNDCPFTMRWSTYQGLPRVHFNVPLDRPDDLDIGDLRWPQCVMDDKKPLPCLTTPSEDPKGRPAPRSCKGRTSSDAQQRWLQDGRQYAPWHYDAANMFRSPDKFMLAPAVVKEQLHQVPRGWTASLQGAERHRALANGWNLGAARLFLVLGILTAMPPPVPAKELSPLGGNAVDAMAKLWETKSLLNGPGVPLSDDAMDLSAILDPEEHWSAAHSVLHQNQSSPQLEPGLLQWLPLWKHWRKFVSEMRYAVAAEVEQLVADLDDEIQQWYFSLKPHVKKAYAAKDDTCSVKVPVVKKLASVFGWQDMEIFDELTEGFPLLGDLRPGLGWRLRSDSRYSEPLPMCDFLKENLAVVQHKLRQQRVDPAWKVMAAEIAADGRMEGPFEAPSCWGKSMVGSDGKPKVRRAEDWKRSLANSTVGVEDSPAYHDKLCRALGLKFKECKAQAPASKHVIQGVQICLNEDEAVLSCTQARKDRMESSLVQLVLDNRLKPSEASTLAGKLHFLASSLFGKSSAAAIRPFHQRAQTRASADYKQGWTLNQALCDAIAFLRYSFAKNVPRVIKFFVQGRSVIYADAFFQLGDERFSFRNMDDAPDWGRTPPAAFANGWGFVATSGSQTWYAMGTVPFWFARHFCSRRAYIYMLEIIAQVLPLYALTSQLHRDVILFVDNEPARHALVKGYSRDSNANKLLQTAWCCFEANRYQPQWQRVASSANISDAVSRQDDSFAKSSGWTLFKADWDTVFDELLRRCMDGPLRGSDRA